MGFTQTSEGRVFFKNADNDDAAPASPPQPNGNTVKQAKPAPANTKDQVLPKDSTQMQILLLLKSLNTKLKSAKDDQHVFKKELAQYKSTIKKLEEKATSQETNYVDLEQKVARKQNESSKKAARFEDNLKTTLKQLAHAKELVKALEEKSKDYDTDLGSLKEQVDNQRKKDEAVIKRQKALEAAQKEQNEKMVNNVAAYVALTKRVGETETQQEALDNKIEETKSDYLKLDRKIDKAIEDRNRILRKVERIEQAVLETRDALNAKAMVLLTDRGAIAGIDMPHLTDDTLQHADPLAISRRIQEESMMPWWRRPVRIQATSFILLLLVVLMAGWLLNQTILASANKTSALQVDTPRVSLYEPTPQDIEQYERASIDINPPPPIQEPISIATAKTIVQNIEVTPAPKIAKSENADIRIHRGYDEYENIMAKKTEQEAVLDINDEEQLIEAFNEDPERVAARLNEIEPESISSEDITAPIELAPKTKAPPKTAPAPSGSISPQNNQTYKTALRTRISPDPKLTDIAKKIETKAFDGVPEAQHDMGAIYVAGHGQIKQDLNRAVLWFTEAANNGVANAKYNLGVLYHQGLGVPESIDKAMELYEEAASLGHPEAQYNLGIASIEGIGIPYNPKKAAAYFEAAADKGITEAAYNLGLIYENGLLGESRPDEALSWYKMASDQGSIEAQSALDQLTNSLGISSDDVNRIVARVRAEQPTKGAQANFKAEKQLIAQIQTELMRRGLYPGPVDGMTGPMTENAIKTFQRAAQIEATGRASKELLGYLRASYN